MKDFGLKKLYYSISEVSKLTDLEQYILRYWETEFDQLKPAKNRAGNRIYTSKDIKIILQIKHLLRKEKYTIEGAKKILSEMQQKDSDIAPLELNIPEPKPSITSTPQKLNRKQETRSINKKDLEEIREFLVDLKSKL
ncbi:MAG: MerR family transcriptional regulator [Melioribacteraceae bacterium]|nr:MerR family transcriptional regulator [Melioribacteraceae bacterium]MCO6472858.1 MerR family transcriptional regulator [Melioribacteraceae bacterium]MDD3559476.1 MerR family transcriptional regulator [Melioribacteraceae bacterium]